MGGDVEKGDGDVSSGYGFLNSRTIPPHEDSNNFKYMDRDVEKDDVSSRYGSMDIHTDLQHNCLESLMNDIMI